MTTQTKFVGIKEFRNNMSEYVQNARKTGTSIVVMKHSEPLFEVLPYDEEESLEGLVEALAEAREDIKHGRVHTQEEILDEFLLKK